MTHRGPSRPIATISFALALALALAACGSQNGSPSPVTVAVASPTPTPLPTASPTESPIPSPSPTPTVDAAKPFLAIFTNPRFAANATITGTIEVGAVSYPVSGAYDIRGTDNRQSLTVAIPNASQVTESVTTAGITYVQKGSLWYVKPAATTPATGNASLASAMRSILAVTDVGIETRKGQDLHHLQPPSTAVIPVSAFGASDPTGDGKVTIDFYVRDDGTPVVMSLALTWTQVSGATRTPAAMALDFEFSNVGGSIVISAPKQVWKTFTSKRYGYSIAYPDDWEVTPSKKKDKVDLFFSAEDTGVAVVRYPTRGITLNEIVSGYRSYLKKESKAKVVSNMAVTVDSVKARQLEWSSVYKGDRIWHLETVVVRGKSVYFVVYSSYAALTATDRAAADAFVSTVDLP